MHEFDLLKEAIVVESGFSIDEWYQDAIDFYETDLKINKIGSVNIVTRIQEKTSKNNMITIKDVKDVSAIKNLDEYEKSAIVSSRIHSNVISPRIKIPFLKTNL